MKTLHVLTLLGIATAYFLDASVSFIRKVSAQNTSDISESQGQFFRDLCNPPPHFNFTNLPHNVSMGYSVSEKALVPQSCLDHSISIACANDKQALLQMLNTKENAIRQLMELENRVFSYLDNLRTSHEQFYASNSKMLKAVAEVYDLNMMTLLSQIWIRHNLISCTETVNIKLLWLRKVLEKDIKPKVVHRISCENFQVNYGQGQIYSAHSFLVFDCQELNNIVAAEYGAGQGMESFPLLTTGFVCDPWRFLCQEVQKAQGDSLFGHLNKVPLIRVQKVAMEISDYGDPTVKAYSNRFDLLRNKQKLEELKQQVIGGQSNPAAIQYFKDAAHYKSNKPRKKEEETKTELRRIR